MPLTIVEPPSQAPDLAVVPPQSAAGLAPAETGDFLFAYPASAGWQPLTGAGGFAYPAWQAIGDTGWSFEEFPRGRIYPSYLASMRESRMAVQFFSDRSRGWFMDAALGARLGIFRFGTADPVRPEGFQLDFEGTAFPRVGLDGGREFQSTDFRAGLPLGFRRGPIEGKFGYYHYCSHLGDTFIQNHPGAVQTPYTRDALVLGLAVRPREPFRVYAEADYAFYILGNADPWQFQFGVDWCTLQPTGIGGAPFFAVNSMIRQDVEFGGNFTVQTGWQWRGRAGESFRAGFHYFNGKSNQGQFFNRFEEHIGLGAWYDF